MSSKSYHASIEKSKEALKTKPGKIWSLIATIKNLFKKKKHVAQPIIPSESKKSVPASVSRTLQPFELVDAREILSSDVIMEILRCLPVKSLIKLQLVCKDWKLIIYRSHFMEKYRDGSAIAHYYYHVDVKKFPSYQANLGQFTTVHSRYGLLLKQSLDDHSFCLCNPAIHKLLQLPNPQKGRYGFALSYVSANRSYSLVSFYKDGDSEACEVFVPGYSKEWRRLTSFPVLVHVIGDKRVKEKRVLVVPSGEYVHCVRVLKYGTITCGEVVSMDVGTESFNVSSLQKGMFRDWMKVEALDWNEKLGFCDIVDGNLEVMVLEDCKKQKWCENKKIIQLPFVKSNNCGNLIPLFVKNGDIWFQDLEPNKEKIFTYTMDTGKVTTMGNAAALPKKFFTYNPSMVSFEAMLQMK